MKLVEEIKKKDKVLAMIIRDDYISDGVDFITPDDFSQQIAYMHHPAGRFCLHKKSYLLRRENCGWTSMMIMKTILKAAY